ncbi:diguanylate cyclase [Demequina litorisediminis]|nr:diguanylate cyclase [Demequina litorisediminis]
MDPLTGLANRAELDRAGAALLAAAARDGHRALVVTLDLDNFKCLNDTHGHDRGDAAIVAVADAFRSATRARDISARTGGDEFVVVMRLSSRADPAAIAARLRAHVAHTIVTEVPEARDVGVDVTLGYACTAEHGYEPRGTPHRSRWGARRRQGGPERPCLRRVPAPSIGHLSAYGDTSPQHGRC